MARNYNNYGIPRKNFKTPRQLLEEKRIITEDNHWFWTGFKDNHGYGQITIDNKTNLVHRVAYKLFKDLNLNDDLMVLHKPPCNIKFCFQPEHLYAGTHDDNMRDMTEMNSHGNSQKVFCKRGHPLVDSNVRIDTKGSRQCKICDFIRSETRIR